MAPQITGNSTIRLIGFSVKIKFKTKQNISNIQFTGFCEGNPPTSGFRLQKGQ